MNKNICRHYKGIMNKECKAGLNWKKSFDNARNCIGKENGCNIYERFTCKELQEQQKELDIYVEKFKKQTKTGLSMCCEAPIDTSHVIQSGRHKGHGARYCSKCKKCLFMV